MTDNFEQFLIEYDKNLDDGDWLSRAIVHLSALLYDLNKKISQAELDESRAIVGYLDQIKDGKKMAVSEAEKRALVDTNNTKHTLDNNSKAIQEMIQAIKRRLDVLSWDYQNQSRIK